MKDLRYIGMNANLKLSISDATLDYIGGIEPALEWEGRGISGKNQKELRELKINRIQAKKKLASDQGTEELNAFLSEAGDVFMKLITGDKEFIRSYLENKKIYFIIGAMRTGGTYLFTELCNIHEIDWENKSLKMVHDTIPRYNYCFDWEQPNQWHNLLFELSQYLVWVKRECMDDDIIIKKRFSLGHVIKLLQMIFGDLAKFIITYRRPRDISISFRKMEEIDMKKRGEPPLWKYFARKRKDIDFDQWAELSYNERLLIFWEMYYEDLLSQITDAMDIVFLTYGKEDYETFLKQEIEKNHTPYEIDKFNVYPKEYDEFWKKKETLERIEKIERLIRIKGY